MADHSIPRRRDVSKLSRRTLLQVGTLATVGLDLPGLIAAQGAGYAAGPHAKAKSCILLFGTGGPAQQETFDPKPDAFSENRGPYDPISTSVPGTQICELLPRLAKLADRYAILRSTYHNSNTHGVGVHWNLTGQKHAPRTNGEPQMSRSDPPSVGGAVRQLRGDRNDLPAAVHLPVRIGDQNNFQWGGQNAGYLGPDFDPLMLIDEHWTPGTLPPAFLPPEEITLDRLGERANLLAQLEAQRTALGVESIDQYGKSQQRALSVLNSSTAWQAFLIEDESPAMLARYGDNKFGRSCLVARRLVEAGVALVTVPWMHLHSTKNFDTHKDHFRLMKDLLLPPVDQAFSALLEDLEERGLLDETLVAWTGEFGRTPKVNQGAGRDHWGKVYSTVLAGGGVRGGRVIGSSDRNGGEPVDRPVFVSDFVATIYHALGFGPSTVVADRAGRPHPLVVGKPVSELF